MFAKSIVLFTLIIFINAETIHIMFIGKTGSGKSSMINTIMEKDVAPVSDFDTCTRKVTEYYFHRNGHNYVFFDTPGFFDPMINAKKIIKNSLGRFYGGDVMTIFICIDLSQPRLTEDEIKIISEAKDIFDEFYYININILYTKTDQIDTSMSFLIEKRNTVINFENRYNTVIKYNSGDYCANVYNRHDKIHNILTEFLFQYCLPHVLLYRNNNTHQVQ